MKPIKQTYIIKAPIEKVWDALVNAKTIEKWGGGPAKMQSTQMSQFSLWGGDIHGKNTKVVKNKKLVQEWYGGDWEKPSKVVFELSQKDGKTTVKLTHTNLPEGEEKEFEKGWKEYYLGPLKKLLEKVA
jgi:activator of HSP90 ATPase